MAESHPTWTFVLPVLAVSISCVIFLRSRAQPVAPFPPGPTPRPLVGNIFDLPLKKSCLKYCEWAKEFNSSVIYLRALNIHIVVLHTMSDAVELLERRSAKYSSRMPSAVVELTGMASVGPVLPYGNAWRKQRRFLEEGLRKDSMPSYHPVQTEKVHLFLDQLLHSPTDFKNHCKMLGTSATMAMIFGYDLVPGHNDHYVELAEFAGDSLSDLLLPGRTLLPIFPFLKHIPPWVPGATTQRLCAQVAEAGVQCKNQPFDFVKRHLAAGTSKHCVLARLLDRRAKNDGSYEDEDVIKDAMAGLYIAGVETMQSAQTFFILAMTLHPDAQAKAQAEIDRVIGSDRLPTFEDRRSLPYVEAVFREVLRWRPITPLGLAHYTTADDVYKGFYIPKGAIVMSNVWAITRDEETYPDPDLFHPERFIKADGNINDHSVSYIYGFGRRICPGRHMADLVVWLMVASVLATFNISKAKDENGNEIDVDSNAITDSVAAHPLPFKCSIVPRSRRAESLIQNAASVALGSLNRSGQSM